MRNNSAEALGFYQNPASAETVLKRLQKKHFYRAFVIHRNHEGRLSFESNLPSLTFLAPIFLAFTALLFFLLISFNPKIALPATLLTFIILSIFLFVYFIINSKIKKSLISKYKKFVIHDESLIIVYANSSHVQTVLNILRQIEISHPISFLLRSDPFKRNIQETPPKESLTIEQLQESAIPLAMSLADAYQSSHSDKRILRDLYRSASILESIVHDVAEAEKIEQTVTLSAEWLLDNNYVIQGNIAEIKRNLPAKFFEKLPKVIDSSNNCVPRIYLIAKELINWTSGKLTRDNIVAFFKSYQSQDVLTIGELWAAPLMFRVRLIECIKSYSLNIHKRLREGELASFWGNRLLNVSRMEPDRLESLLGHLKNAIPHPTEHFAEELLDHLFDEESVLPLVRNWLEEVFQKNITEVLRDEQIRKSVEQIALANAIVSLITLSQLSWQDIFEMISPVDAILRSDERGIYSAMDFRTRDTYRHSIEVLAYRSKISEVEIANKILELAKQGKSEVTRHVGYYLIDAGRPLLESKINYCPTILQAIRRWAVFHPGLVYLGGIAFLTLSFELLIYYFLRWEFGSIHPVIFGLLALIPLSEISIEIMNFVSTQFLPPFILPKMSFKEGIPETCKTLVIIPMLLASEEEIQEILKRLEIHYLSNSQSNVVFGIFCDFTDAPEQVTEKDRRLLDEAVKGIQALENKYGTDKFFLFHRKRTWSISENAWIGWERKRGKLEELNRFLVGEHRENILLKGNPEAIKNIRYVITLDVDTQLQKDNARQLIEAIAHPLNKAYISPSGNIERGYTIIQPMVTTSSARRRRTLFSRIFSDTRGIDPYTQAISNIYQDLVREGSYHGKGIYDVNAFHNVLSNRFPEEHILSHDLIEGAYGKVGFASDILLFDLFPEDYLTWSKRQHRWMRGDWQIIDWLFSRVPNASKQRVSNSLSLINRWKIFDNLRRALMPVAIMTLLIASWIWSTSSFWTLLAFIVVFTPAITSLISNVVLHPRALLRNCHETTNDFLRAGINFALLPYQACNSLDALLRVVYRRLISHRHLLEWSTFNHKSNGQGHTQFILKLTALSFSLLFLLIAVLVLNPIAFSFALPVVILWMFSPVIISVLDKQIALQPALKLTSEDKMLLRKIARKTWRYFDDFVGPQSNWLPPDNFQAALRVEVAPRTSPTNIGLWMLSALTAYDLKYITCDEVIDRVLATFQTIKKLERHEGHLLNWYDITNLNPLYPRYVSTVDNGNLLACLWTLEQGIEEMLSAPILSTNLKQGLIDLFYEMNDEITDSDVKVQVQTLRDIACAPCALASSFIFNIEKASSLVENLLPKTDLYWIKKLTQELKQWQSLFSRYFSWMELIHNIPSEHAGLLSNDITLQQLISTSHSISLKDLALGKLSKLDFIHKDSFPAETIAWINKLKEEIQKAEWLAGEKIGQAHELIKELRILSQDSDMEFLYNSERKVFSIGYQVDDRRLDTSYYDLLASEARIASIISIAKGDVPLEHWWALGRPYKILNGREVLLSWGGTMFEYLMPLLFTKHFPDSLLGEACDAAVACQMIYGKKRGIPWGISESAFSEIDSRKIYQYRSFGIPGMGLKRGLEDDLVVSPYSSALALAINPVAAIKNLQLLKKSPRNLLSYYGYYEAIDFTRQDTPAGKRGVIVYAYMAHHQGMSLISINNLLSDEIMANRFHADPRISGVESLIFERIPLFPAIDKGYKRNIPIAKLTSFPSEPIMGVMDTPQSVVPKVNLLSNNEYSVMVTNAGGGYSRWRDIDITRWRSDTTLDSWGSFCYIKDIDTKTVWSTAFQPTHVATLKYSVRFKADKVEFQRRDNQIETLLEIVVSPEDNAEIRIITLANLSKETRHLELTSYSELALAPHAADSTHPTFNKLFIETEALPQQSALLAFRRLRASDEAPYWAAHIVASNQDSEELQYETDRNKFIGRGNTLINPTALSGELSNSSGTVLDPIFSLRKRIVLEPGQRVQVSFITAISDNREASIALIDKYRDIASSHRALEMAWTNAQLELRHLKVHQEEVQLFQKLASRILYPHSQLRASSDRLRRNKLGQSGLWVHGLSGDLPILVVTIADTHELDLVKQVLIAHAFWRMRGLKVDLVILNEEAAAYEQPLSEQLKRIIQAHAHHSDIEKPGGIFLRNTALIPDEELTLILSVARANLIAARGSLRQQLVSPTSRIKLPTRLIPKKGVHEEPSKPLPYMELPYFNGIGGFTPDGKEYAIYLGPNTSTPAPWINVIANAKFGMIASEAGVGCTWYENSQTNRLTPWSNDPVLNPSSDAIYIRDDELGTFWTPTPSPIRELDAYRIRHGQGYTHYEHNSHGLEQLLTVFVPVDESGGLPLRVQRLRLTNNSNRSRTISVFAYSEWVLGTNKETTQMFVQTEYDPESQALFAYNRYNPDFGSHVAFTCSDQVIKSYTGDRTEFLGRNSSPATPAALRRKGLSGASGAGYDPCSALQIFIELGPNEQKDIVFTMGYAPNIEEARKLILKCREPNWTELSLNNSSAWWDRLLGAITIDIPDLAINFSVNRWLLYQNLSCRIWGRSAFYQSGGAYGFRDQLQDVLALVYTAPLITREQILRAASRQFIEGDVQHWWHYPSGAGVRTRITDDLLWLPYATAHYVKITKDLSILEEIIPFLKGELLKEDQHEAYFIPEVSDESGSLMEHCRRAIIKSTGTGPHGLPLIGGGDWNDGLNRVGILGKGESVWLGWFLIHVMNDFADLLVASDTPEAAEGYRIQSKRLAEVIEEHAWDGKWYRRAYFDNGEPIGSKDCFEATIDSLSQSWAVISGAGNTNRAEEALASVEEKLVLQNEALVLLLTPPFDKSNQDPGYIKGYPPGVRENGGQYTHGSLWVPMALARQGKGDKAIALLKMMHPVWHSQNLEALNIYKIEPYAIAADIYSLAGHVGRGGWTWYTGSAGWMYRIWLEEIIGFKLRGNILTLKPVIATAWERVKLSYCHKNSVYEITIENPKHINRGSAVVELDGHVVEKGEIVLVEDGKTHLVRVVLE